ncbi:MAG: thioredoxin [Deltaproteobacteria bacterium]|nr:thioredoxin [Deltaproteobacteria bacterium]
MSVQTKPANLVELTDQTFDATTSKGIVFVDFWAPWCGPCRAFAPIFEQAASKNPDITFAKLNTEAHQRVAGALQVRAIPTLMIFKEGTLVFSQPGLIPAAGLEDLARQARALDVAKALEAARKKAS